MKKRRRRQIHWGSGDATIMDTLFLSSLTQTLPKLTEFWLVSTETDPIHMSNVHINMNKEI